jgi:HlyD family secretion protein
MRVRRLLVLLLLVAGGAAAYYFYNRPPTSLVLTGVVTTNDVIVSPQIAGKIQQILVAEGDTVKRDQIVATIVPDELMAESSAATHNVEGLGSQVQEAQAALRLQERQAVEQIRQAESNAAAIEAQLTAARGDLENQKAIFERKQSLARERVASPQELDEARSAYQSAQGRVDALNKQIDANRAMIALARANAEQTAVRRSQVEANQHLRAAAAAQQTKADVRLGYTEVRAPADGIVDVRAARVGEVINAGQPIVTLINPDDVWVRADVEETYIDRVRIGDRMKVRLPSDVERDCTVFYRGANAGFATQRDVSRTKRDIKTFEIRLRCDNSDRRLAIGMTAYVMLPLTAGEDAAAPASTTTTTPAGAAEPSAAH